MQYTVLTIKELNDIASQYNIGMVDSHKVLSGGSENTNYLICTGSGSYVLTICEQKTKHEAEQLADLLRHLENNNFQTSKILVSKNDKSIINYSDKPIMLKTFIEGDVIDNLSNDLLESIGEEIGKLHRINAPNYLPNKLNYGVEYFDEVKIYDEHSEFDLWLQKKKENFKSYFSLDLPKALIHSDVFTSNVIISKDLQKTIIMDFEEATYYYRLFDIGMAIIGLCREGKTVNTTKACHLLKGYQKTISLIEEEKKSLQTFIIYAATAMSFWRHKNFNYTNKTEAFKNHYLELKIIADSIEKMSDSDFEKAVFDLSLIHI